MSSSHLRLSNQQARALWLHSQLMLDPPLPASEHHRISDTVEALGMVQLDSIGVLARAHHHILWSRHTSYRNADYNKLLGESGAVFEHFSHDAVILPMSMYPYWRRQHERQCQRYSKGSWGEHMAREKTRAQILETIRKNGPMCSQDFTKNTTDRADKTIHTWMRPPHKLALDYLWLAGHLSVSHRKGFIKYYDVTARVIPADKRAKAISDTQQIDWLCHSALEKLGFATAREIQKFYDACDLAEVHTWLASNQHRVQTVSVETCEGEYVNCHALKNIEQRLANLPSVSSRLRIVNPFDPIARDRDRLKQLFGFDYRIEIYVPAEKRRYGYYVYPLLEGNRFTGRIDVRADRKADCLKVRAWWLEKGVRPSEARTKRLRSELQRLARLAEVSDVDHVPEASTTPPA